MTEHKTIFLEKACTAWRDLHKWLISLRKIAPALKVLCQEKNAIISNLFEIFCCKFLTGHHCSLPEDLYYFAHIRSDARVFLEKPKVGLPPYKGRGYRPKKETIFPGQVEAGKVSNIAKFHNIKWTSVVLDEGAKEPIIADVSAFRVYPSRNGLPEESPVWLFLRRSADGQIKFALSNAPEDIPFKELCKASLMRWPIEQCFQDGKSHLGMGDYEHRSWPAWHRHMLYVFLALSFLFQLRLKFKKNAGVDIASGSKVSNGGIATGFT